MEVGKYVIIVGGWGFIALACRWYLKNRDRSWPGI